MEPLAVIETGRAPCQMAEMEGALWVTNFRAGTVTRINPESNVVDRTIEVGRQPCAIAASNGALWIGLLREWRVVRVDTEIGEVTHTLDVASAPWDIQVGHGSVWVTLMESGELLRLDPADLAVLASVDEGDTYSGLALTDTRVWFASRLTNEVMSVDPRTNEVVERVELEGQPHWFAVGSDSILVTLWNDDRVALLSSDSGQVRSVTPVGQEPRDPGLVGDRYWIPNEGAGTVSVLSQAGALLGTFTLPDHAGIYTVGGHFGDGWVANFGSDAVMRVPGGVGAQ